jgi:acid phosphatase class B
MRKSMVALLLSAVALLAVAATPAFAIEKGSPFSYSGSSAEALAVLQSHVLLVAVA